MRSTLLNAWLVKKITATCSFAGSIFLLVFFLFSSTASAQAFTLDGLPNDWPAILNNASNPTKVFVRDANSTNDNQFTNGARDPGLISTWIWSLGQTNDKGDISNAGAALIGTKLCFFGDRTAINGDAQIGFWFFQNNVAPLGTTGGGFSSEHKIGDILVLSNFTNGGGNVVLRVYEWVGSGGSDGTLNLGNLTPAQR